MLLTSSQVSVAVSSGIVFVFTVALFLSGYAIQQRTLRDLRVAIKPRPHAGAQIFLPDRFRRSTTELQDGTVVALDSDFDRDSKYSDHDFHARRSRDGIQDDPRSGALVVAHARPTQPHDPATDTGGSPGSGGQKRLFFFASWARSNAVEKETQRPSHEDEVKPVSRAERRRRIKEEIRRLSQGEERGYYQRRLW